MKSCARWAALAAVLLLPMCWPTSAVAVVPQNGWGFALADDDYIGDAGLPPSVSGSGFAMLRPKTFRFQIYWDADPALIAKARNVITRVRQVGVEQVVVTFKEHGQNLPAPSVTDYTNGITSVVQQMHDVVEVWGPANEPNSGETWLPGTAGAEKLAAYYNALGNVIAAHDPGALRTSPDFVDTMPTTDLANYVTEYLYHGGGWGDYIAFHPYKWINRKLNGQLAPSVHSITKLAELAPGNKPIWITEIGAAGRAEGHNDSEADQTYRINWMVANLQNHSRVARIYYYHMKGKASGFDTALLNTDLSSRMAWRAWCAASHGNNYSHPDCVAYVTPPVAQTGGAGGINQTQATVFGTVNANGSDTTHYFEYGTTPYFGSIAPIPSASSGSGTTAIAHSTRISGLVPGTTYHYRIVASKPAGTSISNNGNGTFTTAPATFFSSLNNNDSMSFWSFGSDTGWQQTSLFGHPIAAGTTPVTLTIDGLPHAFYVDAGRGNQISYWSWGRTTGWHQTHLSTDSVTPGTDLTAIKVDGKPQIFFVNANNNDTITVLTRPASTWQQVHLFGHRVAANSSPSAIVANGAPHVFFSDAYNGNTTTAWSWKSSIGWHQIFMWGHPVAPGSSPSAVSVGGSPYVFYADAYHSNTLTVWQWNSSIGWHQTFLYGHALASGSSPSALEYSGMPYAFFADAYHSDTVSRWALDPSTGWQQAFLYGHPVAAGSSPSAKLINGLPNVFFSNGYQTGKMSLWNWSATLGWQQTHLGGDSLTAGSSPSR